MAFDVLRTQEFDQSFPEYSFYSGIKNKYVTVTLQSDGDSASQFDEIEDAVAFYNKLPGVPEIAIRDNTERSPTKRTYAFDYENKKVTRTTASSIKKTIQLNQNRADIITKFQLLNNFIEACDPSTVITREDYLGITSILRSLNITSIGDLNSFFPPNIPVRKFLNPTTLHGLTNEDAASLSQEVPELTQFMDLTNHTTITQAQIDSAINGISNLSHKLGLDIGTYENVPENLGDKILALPGFDAFVNETDASGTEFFPEGTKSGALANSNFEFFETTRVNVPESNRTRIEQLIKEGRAFFNPFEATINKINTAGTGTTTAIAYGLTLLPGDAKLTTLSTALAGLTESVANFNSHISKLTTIIPPTTTNPALSLSSALGTSLQNLLNNPLGGLDSFAADSFEIVALVESSSQFVAEQAATVDGDWDSLDKKSGFRLASIDPLMGSLISPSYQLILQELLAVLTETPNYVTDRETMCRKHDLLVARYALVRKERELQELVDKTIPEYSQLVAAEAALSKAAMYFDQRIANSIPLSVDTTKEFKTHFTYIGSWMPGVLTYYSRLLTNIIVAEISGYRTASIRSQRFNLLDQGKASASLLNAIATPELNQAAKAKKHTDDNVVRTSIPLKRVSDKDFDGTFKLGHFVGPDIGAPYRLRNFERDYMGEVNVFTSEDIKNNLRELNNKILAPMQAVGFDFEVVRGLRPFNHEKGEAGKYNNSDHHYGLAVDIKLRDPNLTGIAAAYIRKCLPWNKLVLFNFNQGSKANSDAYIHISHYSKPSHGWDKNHAVYPTGCGAVKVIGGNGVSIPGFFAFESTNVVDIPAPISEIVGLSPDSVQAIHLDGSDVGAMVAKLGLGNLDNTSDANKPISVATQVALTNLSNSISNISLVVPDDSITALKLKTSDINAIKAKLGLGNVNNTADLFKPISNATQAALGDLQTQISNLSIGGIADDSITAIKLNTADVANIKVKLGLGNLNNTSDANKPISVATQAALDLKANINLLSGGTEIAATDGMAITLAHKGQIIVGSNSTQIEVNLASPSALGTWVALIAAAGTASIIVNGVFDSGLTSMELKPEESMLFQSNGLVHRALLRSSSNSGLGTAPVSILYATHPGTGTSGPFTLQTTPTSLEAVTITVGPLVQPKDGTAYTITGDQIMFAEPIPVDTFWSEEIINSMVSIVVGTVPPNSVGAAQIKSIETTAILNKLGLDQVDNTSDINKPVSTAQQAAIGAAIADLYTEIFTGDEVVLTGPATIDATYNRKIVITNSLTVMALGLASPSALGAGWMSIISNTGSANVTVQGTFDDGNTNSILIPGGSMVVQSNGSVHRLLLRGAATSGIPGGGDDRPGEGIIAFPTRETLIGNGTASYTLSVTPPNEDSILIFVGGAIQSKSSFALLGADVTFSEPVATDEIIEIYVVRGTVSVGIAPLYKRHPGTDSAGPFTLNAEPYAEEALRISVGGMLQPKEGAYTLTGDQILFSEPISSLTYWEEEIIQPFGIGEPSDNTVSAAKIKTSDIPGIRTKLSVDSSAEVDAKLASALEAFDVADQVDAKIATRQPLDADLTAIAALATKGYGREFLILGDADEARAKLVVDSSMAVDTKIEIALQALFNSVPEGLNTLDLMAKALEDDASFAQTMRNLIETKQPLNTTLEAISNANNTAFGLDFLTLVDEDAARNKLNLDSRGEVDDKISAAANALLGDAPHAYDTLGKLADSVEALLSNRQETDEELTAIAALTTTNFGRDFLTLVSQAAARTKLDVAPKQSSTTDTGSGKGLIVGAFGLGSENGITISDCNVAIENGFYTLAGSSTNVPSWANSSAGTLIVISRNGVNSKTQLFFNYQSSHMGIRYWNGTVWSDWSRFYSNNNIIGTVSQTSAVPTGAIIEQGNNSNGRYTKFADGTLICYPDNGGYDGNKYLASGWQTGATVTLPASFINGTYNVTVSAHAADSSGYSGAVATFETKSVGSFRVRRPVGVTDTGTTLLLSYVAIGRWF